MHIYIKKYRLPINKVLFYLFFIPCFVATFESKKKCCFCFHLIVIFAILPKTGDFLPPNIQSYTCSTTLYIENRYIHEKVCVLSL